MQLFASVLLLIISLPFLFISASFFGVSPLLEINLSVSPIALISVAILLVIFISILFFSFYYLVGYPHLVFFWTTNSLFVISIIILLSSFSPITFITGWDGLGLTSYILVCYYGSWEASNSGIVTVLSNRLGDGFLMWFFALCFNHSFTPSVFFSLPLFSSLLLITSLTNSSQTPFSSWLPQAIAAPTPVSSLVHSSTLVTAGVFLVLNFYSLFSSFNTLSLLFFFGWVTILVSGGMSIIESDGNNVIALSTLNQLGLIFLGLSYGNSSFVFFHLVSHAFFNSCIFIQVGFIISSSFGSQELRSYSFNLNLNPISSLLLTSSLFSLLGLTFISGFYSNELLLSLFVYYSNNSCTLLLVGVSVVFSFLYTSRILNILIDNNTNNCFNHSSSYWVWWSLFLFILGLSFGSLFNSNFYFFGSVFSFQEVNIVFILFILIFQPISLNSAFFLSIGFQDNLYKSLNLTLINEWFNLDHSLVHLNSWIWNSISQSYNLSLGSIQFSILSILIIILFLN